MSKSQLGLVLPSLVLSPSSIILSLPHFCFDFQIFLFSLLAVTLSVVSLLINCQWRLSIPTTSLSPNRPPFKTLETHKNNETSNYPKKRKLSTETELKGPKSTAPLSDSSRGKLGERAKHSFFGENFKFSALFPGLEKPYKEKLSKFLALLQIAMLLGTPLIILTDVPSVGAADGRSGLVPVTYRKPIIENQMGEYQVRKSAPPRNIEPVEGSAEFVWTLRAKNKVTYHPTRTIRRRGPRENYRVDGNMAIINHPSFVEVRNGAGNLIENIPSEWIVENAPTYVEYEPPGEPEYIFDVENVHYKHRSEGVRENLKLGIQLKPNELTESLLKAIAEQDPSYVNENYYYKEGDFSLSTIRELKGELTSLPINFSKGSINGNSHLKKNIGFDKENGAQLELLVKLEKAHEGYAEAKFTTGSHSIAWTVTSQADWTSGSWDTSITPYQRPGSINLIGENSRGLWKFEENSGQTAHDNTEWYNDGSIIIENGPIWDTENDWAQGTFENVIRENVKAEPVPASQYPNPRVRWPEYDEIRRVWVIDNATGEVVFDLDSGRDYYAIDGYENHTEAIIEVESGKQYDIRIYVPEDKNCDQYMTIFGDLDNNGSMEKLAQRGPGTAPVTFLWQWTIPENYGSHIIRFFDSEEANVGYPDNTVDNGEIEDYTLFIKYKNGKHTTDWRDLEENVGWSELIADVTIPGENLSISANVQVDIEGDGVADDNLLISLDNGTRSYDISSLREARYIRIISTFFDDNNVSSPKLNKYEITLNLFDPWKCGTALEFTGNGDYVDIPDNVSLDLSEEITLAAWVKPDTIPASGLMSIASKGTNGKYHIDSNGELYLWFENNTGSIFTVTSSTALTEGEWYHLAFTIDSNTDNAKVFVNGVMENSTTFSGLIANNNSSFLIGADVDTSTGELIDNRFFDGKIDEVCVFNRALTDNEIKSLWATGTAYWPFEAGSGTTAWDNFGNNDGTIYGASRVSGEIGKALQFDGVDDYVEVPGPKQILAPDALTFAAWIKITPGWQNYDRIVAKKDDLAPSAPSGWSLEVNPHGYMTFLGSGDTGGDRLSLGWTENVWHHLAITKEAGANEVKGYLDGIYVDNQLCDTISPNSKPLTLAYYEYQNLYLPIVLDEVQIYNRALTPDEIYAIAHGELVTIKSDNWKSRIHDFGRLGSFTTLQTDSTIEPGENVQVTLQVSDDNFETIAGSITKTLVGGTVNLDISTLPHAMCAKISFNLKTDNTRETPVVHSFTVNFEPSAWHLVDSWTGDVNAPAAPPPAAPPIRLPVSAIFYAAIASLGALGGGFAVYWSFFRRLKPEIPLKRLGALKPKIFGLPRRHKPKISIEELSAVPILLAPAVPEAFEPVPVAPLLPKLERKKPSTLDLPFPDILKRLKNLPDQERPEISLSYLMETGKPIPPSVPLKRLIEAGRHGIISSEKLERVIKAPKVSLERLEKVIRTGKREIPERLKREVGPAAEEETREISGRKRLSEIASKFKSLMKAQKKAEQRKKPADIVRRLRDEREGLDLLKKLMKRAKENEEEDSID